MDASNLVSVNEEVDQQLEDSSGDFVKQKDKLILEFKNKLNTLLTDSQKYHNYYKRYFLLSQVKDDDLMRALLIEKINEGFKK